jgi:hypothetical protein
MTRRIWNLSKKTFTAQELAEEIAERSWTLCTAFRLGDKYIVANDAFSEDGAGEWAIFIKQEVGGDRLWPYRQIESYTFGWMTKEKILEGMIEICEGEYDDQALGELPADHFEVHSTCRFCA